MATPTLSKNGITNYKKVDKGHIWSLVEPATRDENKLRLVGYSDVI